MTGMVMRVEPAMMAPQSVPELTWRKERSHTAA